MENKRKISAKIVADSIDPRGNRITTFVLTYPRFIHAELLTHRLFSRNAASSRAIPFKKMVEDIENDPFIPIAWQKDHKGMQGVEYITGSVAIQNLTNQWLKGRDEAIKTAKSLNKGAYYFKVAKDENGNNMRGFECEDILDTSVTKQLCNRLLEPFQWYTCLVTATEFDNFYELRCPKFINEHEDGEDISFSRKDFIKKLQERYPTNWEMELKDFFGIKNNTEEEWFSLSKSGAEIHIQALAEAMWDAQNESIPNQLEAGEWHMPFMGNFDPEKLLELSGYEPENFELVCRKIATARCARLSYMTFDGEIDYEKDIKLHDQLIGPPFHASPFEHCCRVMSDDEYECFYKGKLYKKHLTTSGTGRYSSDEEWEVWEKDSDYNNGWCNNIKGFIQYRYLLENE